MDFGRSLKMFEKYKEIFCQCMQIDAQSAENASSENSEWESLKQMNLVSALEDEFDLDMEPDDIVEITSFSAGIEILKKYGVKF
jgi:acyl carrier protein